MEKNPSQRRPPDSPNPTTCANNEQTQVEKAIVEGTFLRIGGLHLRRQTAVERRVEFRYGYEQRTDC